MTLYGFYQNYTYSCTFDIKVLSSYNGKLLCKNYNPKKHSHLNSREVRSMWPDLVVVKGVLGSSIAKPILCLYVDGREEYEEEQKNKKQT